MVVRGYPMDYSMSPAAAPAWPLRVPRLWHPRDCKADRKFERNHSMASVTKVLIANRAEIAGRIIRTAKRMGIATVAVYSDADANLPYVREADEAVFIGPPAPGASYLDQAKIINAAISSGADAIHPGYGFLSENAGFAEAVEAAGITWVGPTPASMRKLGSKTDAKAVAVAAGVPVVPWFEVLDDKTALKQAADIGFPVIVKPSAGGGGKGMYRCDSAAELETRIPRARREAESSFGDGSLLVEKFLVDPRHIEVQIIADTHGTVLHLFERECSMQRRNQKLIEESPCVALSQEQRETLCRHAVNIARAAGYTSAGTCEFLYDTKAMGGAKWYFCEMNTRLQVEHPVTEAVTGVDLVELMLRVARGERLGLLQSDIKQTGHAIEFRIISEDPFTGFTPSLGVVDYLKLPVGEGIRVDAGYAQGDSVTPHYDSLLAKLIVHGDNRPAAFDLGRAALLDFHCLGVQTCVPFHLAALTDPGFKGGNFHIHHAERRMAEGLVQRPAAEEAAMFAAIMEWRHDQKTRAAWQREGRGMSAWTRSGLPGMR